METTNAAATASDPAALMCFEVGSHTYAIDVAHMREVVRWQPTTPLPKGPPLIVGVLDLRGLVVPVVDMGRALGGEPTRASPSARILVIEFDEMLVGLAVDSATAVVSTPLSSLDAPPALAAKVGYEAIGAVVRRSQAEPILVLSIEHLLVSLDGSARANPGAGR